jgi:hypothetical protein
MTRTSGFGIGDRLKARENFAPPATRYEIPSFVEVNRRRRAGKSFGLDRESTQPRGYIELGPVANPGAGAYNPETRSGSPKWSMGKRITDKISDPALHNGNPSPGLYTPPAAISRDGRQSWSKYENSKSPTFAKGNRFF